MSWFDLPDEQLLLDERVRRILARIADDPRFKRAPPKPVTVSYKRRRPFLLPPPFKGFK